MAATEDITEMEPPVALVATSIIAASAEGVAAAVPPMPNSPSDVFAMDEPRDISELELGEASKAAPRTADGAPVFGAGAKAASFGRPLPTYAVGPRGLCCVLDLACAAACVGAPKRDWKRFFMALTPMFPVVQALRCNCDAIPGLKVPMMLFGIFACLGGATRFWHNIPLNPNKQAVPGTHAPSSFNGLSGLATLAMAIRLAVLTYPEIDTRIEDGGENCDAILFQNAVLCCSVVFVVTLITIVVAIATKGNYPERQAAWADAAPVAARKPKFIAKAGDVECGMGMIVSASEGQPPKRKVAVATKMTSSQNLGRVAFSSALSSGI